MARRPEKKVFDGSSSFAPSTAGVVIDWGGIVQGAAEQQRVGNVLGSYAIVFHIQVTWDPLAVKSGLRFILMWDTRVVPDTFPTYLEIFGTATPSLMEYIIQANYGRFITLWDRVLMLRAKDLQGTNQFLKVVRRLRKPSYFNGPLITDVQQNRLVMVVFSNEAAGLAPNILIQSRMYAYDS